MSGPWQRQARLIIAIAAVAFAIVVAFAFQRREENTAGPAIARTDPKAVVESASGRTLRINRDREDIRVEYDRLLTYQDGSSKMLGVTVITERAGGRTFTVKAREANAEKDESNLSMTGDVQLSSSDGLALRTERATYAADEGMVRAPGPVEFSRGRLKGFGVGLTYDKNRDVAAILDQVSAHIAPDASGAGGVDISSRSAEINRAENSIRFEGTMKAVRAFETIDADAAVARLSAEEERLERLELRGSSRVAGSRGGVGALQVLTGRDIDLEYATDGQSVEHAVITGDAVIQLAGEADRPGRRISAGTIDMAVAPDGATPTALAARDNVELALPADESGTSRTIRAQRLDGKGEAGRGLTSARFTGEVQFRERGPKLDRIARSGALDVTLAPGAGAITEAIFSRAVRFGQGTLAATAASARYAVDGGTLDLTGTEANGAPPRVVNDRMAIDANRIDMILDGPHVKASGAVRSSLQPPATVDGGGAAPAGDTKMPSMLKRDQIVHVTANDLIYDGAAAKATYTGNARLSQGDTSVKAGTIVLDDRTGDLTATGSVATATVLVQDAGDGKKERTASVATADGFQYNEALRRGTYEGSAHVSGPQGDLTAAKVELYLKPPGDELDRVEAYEAVTLREQSRRTTGARMTYFSADQRYVVVGTPVTVVDECGRETTGRTLTFYKAADRIVVDGNERARTQTKGGANCR